MVVPLTQRAGAERGFGVAPEKSGFITVKEGEVDRTASLSPLLQREKV